jgi:uncharacterized protein with NRDE domain
MCLLALFFRVVEDAPVVLGANREELYARGGEPPRLIGEKPRILAGIDPAAGGTWLGVNEYGVVVAVTNRPKSVMPERPRSRGLLVRDLLTAPAAAVAVERATKELNTQRYAGCNLLCADADAAVVLHGGDWLRVRPLPPGIHVFTSHDVNDLSDRRTGHALWWLSQKAYTQAAECVEALQELCAQPGNEDPPICLHGEKGGTVSSTILALSTTPARSLYFHAQGPPDQTPFADLSPLVRGLLAGPLGHA